MNIFAVGAFITGILIFFLGIFVYFKNRKRLENRIFGLMSLSLTVWSINFALWQMAEDKTTAFLFVRLLMIGAIFIPVFYIHYIFSLLELVQKRIIFLAVGYTLTLILVCFSFTSFIIKDLRPLLGFSHWPEGGILFHFWLFWFVGALSYGIYLLIKNLLEARGIKKEQIKYVTLASILAFAGGLTIFPLWYEILIPPVGIFVIFLYPLILAYAITRYRLMDIRLVAGKGIVYLFSFILVIVLALLLLFLNSQLIKPFPVNLAVSLILIISILFFQPIFRFLKKIAAKYFYYAFYSYQTVLTELGIKLTRVLELDKLSSLIVSTLMDTMKLERVVVLLREPESGEYRIQKNIGFREENGISLVKDNFLTVFLEKKQKPLVYEELSLITKDIKSEEEKKKMEELKKNMKRIEAALCLPLLIENKIIGMIVLGNKLSGEYYSVEDVNLLTVLSNQASIAFQNARSYSEIKGFSKKLEIEVERATKELKEAYEELKKLDRAKSEFISMASHQLRTPLSAVKGYISMMIEGVYGKPPGKMKEKLQNVLYSNERLIKIVNDLLDVSRIELGKMVAGKSLTQIEELVQSCYDEMKASVENKNLKIVFRRSKKLLPKVKVDSSKIRQVILNLIDNATRYTQEGKIELGVEKVDENIRISVKDTGEGLKEEEKEQIFESFTRGTVGIARWIEGTGLGLHIAKKYLELHNGKIWAESKGKGKGSTFFVDLPLK